jgi:hypothetical protein
MHSFPFHIQIKKVKSIGTKAQNIHVSSDTESTREKSLLKSHLFSQYHEYNVFITQQFTVQNIKVLNVVK